MFFVMIKTFFDFCGFLKLDSAKKISKKKFGQRSNCKVGVVWAQILNGA